MMDVLVLADLLLNDVLFFAPRSEQFSCFIIVCICLFVNPSIFIFSFRVPIWLKSVSSFNVFHSSRCGSQSCFSLYVCSFCDGKHSFWPCSGRVQLAAW